MPRRWPTPKRNSWTTSSASPPTCAGPNAASGTPRRPRRSRSRSSAWPAASPAARTPPRTCGTWWRGAGTRSPHCPATAAGTWTLSTIRTWNTPAPRTSAPAASCTTPGDSTPPSSESARPKPSAWPRSSGSPWRPPGRPSNARASTPGRCDPRRSACSSAATASTTASATRRSPSTRRAISRSATPPA